MFIMPEVVIHKVISKGINDLKADPAPIDEIFACYLEPELIKDYGQSYIDNIKTWFVTTKIPVVQAWSLNAQRIPCYSVHLATELEDESKAAAGDYFGEGLDDAIGVSVFNVMVDIGCHANKSGDQVIWLYYILAYILLKYKLVASRLGMQLHTWNASDYSKQHQYMAENIFTRWVRFRCTTENTWLQERLGITEEVELDLEAGRIGDDDDSENVPI